MYILFSDEDDKLQNDNAQGEIVSGKEVCKNYTNSIQISGSLFKNGSLLMIGLSYSNIFRLEEKSPITFQKSLRQLP